MTAHKKIVFDWNGTLFDDIYAMHAATNSLLQMEGYKPLPLETFRSIYTVPLEDLYRKMGLTEPQIEKMMTLEHSSFHDTYESLVDTIPLRDGAHDILMHARDHKIHAVILSNHIVEPIRKQLRRLDVEHLFHEVLAYADRATQFKDMTKGERLRRFMAENEWQPEHTIIVGDSVEEIHIGQEQGFVTVGITGGSVTEERLRGANPDYLIHSLRELKPILIKHGFVS